ncbi:MAG: S-layer homology domain-containing protein [Thermoanaerobaculia bacterium]
MDHEPHRLSLGFVLAGLLAGNAAVSGQAMTIPAAYGTQDEAVLVLGAWDFEPDNSATTFQLAGFADQLLRYTLAGNVLIAGVHLPTGALVTGLEFTGCDQDPDQSMGVIFAACDDTNLTAPCVLVQTLATPTGSPGCSQFTAAVADFGPIDNGSNSYFAYVLLGDSDALRFRTVRVRYRLTVSPPPATPTFDDVPTNHPFFPYIEALAASGITSGCATNSYCPNTPLTRGQMAVFLAKALGLHWPD